MGLTSRALAGHWESTCLACRRAWISAEHQSKVMQFLNKLQSIFRLLLRLNIDFISMV